MKQLQFIVVALLLAVGATHARTVERTWVVDGAEREALIALPDSKGDGSHPLVFVFHGHGGTMRHAMLSMGVNKLWPESIVVYPQGLPTPGAITDPEGRRAGWQKTAGDQGDRDLKFVDAMMATIMKEYPVDSHRVFATGHSNGGAFTYLLWAERPSDFAAFAPSSGLLGKGARFPTEPRPILHIAGRTDELVKFEWQERMIAFDLRTNQCSQDGTPWPKGGKEAEIHRSKVGAPVVTWMHPGGHRYPDGALKAVVAFFKSYDRINER
ncbi:MAG: prolyl oligopeptidase family serine peptidase [Opitutaceae bacterium]|nr:prolyl oligopeptidase family serine peptidase [Opitutaceae bacterium]